MSGLPIISPEAKEAPYWQARVLEETRAALLCDDARAAAVHVELATRFLRRAQQGTADQE